MTHSPFPPPNADAPPPALTENSVPASGRDRRCRFAKNKAGTLARRVAARRVAFLRKATEDDLTAIADRFLAKAREGDAEVRAARPLEAAGVAGARPRRRAGPARRARPGAAEPSPNG